MVVGKIHEGAPVGVGDVVFAGPEVVADGAFDQLVWGRRGHFADGQAVGAQKAVDRVGGQGGQELAFGVSPEVFRRRANEHGPGSNQRNELMLVDRKLVLAAVVLAKVGAEPVRERGVDPRNGFAEVAPRECGPATAGIVRDHHGEPLVLGTRPERGLPQAGVAHDDDFSRVDLGRDFEVIDRTRKAPGPCADRTHSSAAGRAWLGW